MTSIKRRSSNIPNIKKDKIDLETENKKHPQTKYALINLDEII